MAERTSKKRIRKSETVRERSSKAGGTAVKPRRLRKTAGTLSKPFKTVTVGMKIVLRPFRFLLWPFKTRPARFIGRLLTNVLLLKYFRNSFKELKKVVWPSRKETVKSTLAVLVFALFFGLIIAVVDYGLDKVFKKILLN